MRYDFIFIFYIIFGCISQSSFGVEVVTCPSSLKRSESCLQTLELSLGSDGSARWPHGGRSTFKSTCCGFACSLGSLVGTPTHPSSFWCLWALSASCSGLLPWVAPPAHAGHSSQSGLSCHCVSVSRSVHPSPCKPALCPALV
ncbi:hypothetical protein BDV29DRAFT_182844 [Aspergillus leporis]|jgi:hypothetical protein|uniref:Secreted protein n=1 Tax=Aspergillus leporis TaxID=41062 RepID=A0A5N5WLD3_9EURO|nr:hypothetical protein BDV29DRAFT_182844 [Aspergillus leporis]